MKFSMNSFLAGVILADDFHRHALDKVPRPVLLGFVHDAHAALENLAHDFVTELILDRKKRGHAVDVSKLHTG